MFNRTPLLAAAVVLGVTISATADDYSYRTVAKTGDTAPSTLGGVFTGFGLPYINASGQVAFTATTTAVLGSSGMWMTPANDPGAVVMITGTNFPIPGGPPEVRFGDFHFSYHHPRLTDAGNVGFSAPLTGLGDDQETGIFRLIDGTMSKVAIPGDPAPGLPGLSFESVSNLVAINESNLMTFKSDLTGPGVNADNKQALYMHWFGGLNLLKRSGNPVPGMPGSTFGGTSTFWMNINNQGRIAFQSYINNGEDTVTSYWTGWPGLLTLVAQGGEASPAGPPYTWWINSVVGTITSQDGMTFITPVIVGNDVRYGLWYYDGESTETIAVGGSVGPLGTYVAVRELCSTAADGTTVFRAIVNAPASINSAVFRKEPGQPATVIAREDDPAPGYWGGVVFDDFDLTYTTIVDDQGRTHFIARVRGIGVSESNNMGHWVVDAGGTPHLAIRTGQWITLDDGIARQVDGFQVATNVGMHTGVRPGINNAGDVALRVHFTDDTSAIIVAEPASCLGDLNSDGVVDVFDLLILLGDWGACGGCDADLNSSGAIDIFDLLQLLSAWGSCP